MQFKYHTVHDLEKSSLSQGSFFLSGLTGAVFVDALVQLSQYIYSLCIPNRWVLAQSVFYHLYNQVSYMSLNEISPLTFSIGNTMKRVSVIVSSIIVFHTPVLPVNAVGAAIAILGTFLYSQVSIFNSEVR